MSDIEAAITSSIAGLSGSESSSSGSSDSGAAATDTSSAAAQETPAETGSEDAVVGGGDGAAQVVSEQATEETPAAAPQAPEAVAPAAPTAAEETLETLTAELAGKRDNRIPYPRVKKIIDNQVKKAVTEVEQQYAQFRTPEFQNGITAMRVADENPAQFLAALAQADPRYAELLAGARVLAGAQQPQQQGRRQAQQPQQQPMQGDVEPDIQLSDGTLGYSADATRRLLAAERAKMEDAVLSRFEDRLKSLEPIEQEHRINTLRAEAAQRVSQQIAAAEQWPGFAESKELIAKAITDATKAGKVLSLQDAYIQVVIPKFRADENTVRQKVLSELKKAPAASSGAPGAGSKAATVNVVPGVDPVEAAIKASIAGIK